MAARRRSNRERSIWPRQDGRRTGAAYLAHKDLGVLPRDTLKILGQARIAVTMEIYTEPDDASRRAGLTKLSALFSTDPG